MRKGLMAVVILGALAILGQPAMAQMYIYPDQGQSPEKENQDKYDCSQWATQTTGVNPTQPAQVYRPPQQQQGFGALGTAARGAAVGAIGGAIGGAAGEGAAIGAAVGGFLGILRRRQEVQQNYQAQEQEIQRHNYALHEYDRAFATCLRGRGYTVSQ